MSIASAAHVPPLFSTPVRWTLRVLSWLAFGLSAYLAWYAVTGSSVASCGFGDSNGCDVVLTSSWSKWLGLPVAVMGLACYAALAALSVVLGVRNPGASRWINTAFLAFAMLAAGASAWFLGLQFFVIGSYCIFCIATDLCGLAIGVISVASTVRWLMDTSYLRRRASSTGVMALRTTLPGAPRSSAVVTSTSPKLPTPSLAVAVTSALSLLIVLTAVQIVYPGKTHTDEKIKLDQSIALAGSTNPSETESGNQVGTQPHVAMRVPSEDRALQTATANRDGEDPVEPTETAGNNETPAKSERLVKFLDGKLTLDVYKHPLIGSPNAPHIMVEMVSYDCPHCRKMHRTIERGLSRYGKQVAVIVMPIPFERGCNKFITTATDSHRGACATARLAIGVAAIRPSAFAGFHNWLMSGDKEKAPRIEKVLPKAHNTVDRNRLRSFIHSVEADKQIAEYVDLFGRLRASHSGNKQFGLPVQILGDHVLSGSVEKEEDVYAAWEKHLGVEPR
jgi:uncharacterized membrane protein